jgi:hypothetical protein
MRGVYEASVKITGLNEAMTFIWIDNGPYVVDILEATIQQCGDNVVSQNIECAITPIDTVGNAAGSELLCMPTEKGDQDCPITIWGALTTEPGAYNSAHDDHQGVPSIGGYVYSPDNKTVASVAVNGDTGIHLISTPDAADFVASIKFQVRG